MNWIICIQVTTLSGKGVKDTCHQNLLELYVFCIKNAGTVAIKALTILLRFNLQVKVC